MCACMCFCVRTVEGHTIANVGRCGLYVDGRSGNDMNDKLQWMNGSQEVEDLCQ